MSVSSTKSVTRTERERKQPDGLEQQLRWPAGQHKTHAGSVEGLPGAGGRTSCFPHRDPKTQPEHREEDSFRSLTRVHTKHQRAPFFTPTTHHVNLHCDAHRRLAKPHAVRLTEDTNHWEKMVEIAWEVKVLLRESFSNCGARPSNGLRGEILNYFNSRAFHITKVLLLTLYKRNTDPSSILSTYQVCKLWDGSYHHDLVLHRLHTIVFLCSVKLQIL